MIDLGRILDELAAERPVFHSEKDFQVALGMEIGKTSGTPVRLEYRPLPTEKIYLVPVRKVGISGIGAGGKRPRSIPRRRSGGKKVESASSGLDRPVVAAAAGFRCGGRPPVASRRARSGAGCCNRSGAMADSGVRPAWDAGEPGASGCGRTPPIGRRP